jgi:hypothetical protein
VDVPARSIVHDVFWLIVLANAGNPKPAAATAATAARPHLESKGTLRDIMIGSPSLRGVRPRQDGAKIAWRLARVEAEN